MTQITLVGLAFRECQVRGTARILAPHLWTGCTGKCSSRFGKATLCRKFHVLADGTLASIDRIEGQVSCASRMGPRLISIVVFVFISFTVAAEIDSDEPIGGRLVQSFGQLCERHRDFLLGPQREAHCVDCKAHVYRLVGERLDDRPSGGNSG